MTATSYPLGKHLEGFVSSQVQAGRYKDEGEVMRAALRLLEEHEQRRTTLTQALQAGEDSGVAEGFDFDAFLAKKRAQHGAASSV